MGQRRGSFEALRDRKGARVFAVCLCLVSCGGVTSHEPCNNNNDDSQIDTYNQHFVHVATIGRLTLNGVDTDIDRNDYQTVRDVAATVGMWGTVGKTANVSTADYPDLMYSLYLDNPMDVSGGRQRSGTGLLLDKKGLEEKGQGLLDSNPSLEEEYAKMDETAKEDLTASARFKLLPWDSTTLPSVDAAVVQFPHTGGFVSALVSSYKVRPRFVNIHTCVCVCAKMSGSNVSTSLVVGIFH